MPKEPLFPLRLINLTNGEEQLFSTFEEAADGLEIWDTDDPTYAEDYLLLDGKNRRVRLALEGIHLRVFELYDTHPLPEEAIARQVAQARKRWQSASQGNRFHRLLRYLQQWLDRGARKR
ncbi:MAG: hypothetical protein KatS3mg019_1000 [Fimbriimonadales bacterium]|nr:MAG: hypothetical protein KatS3mg019_1000 [Fimbriimonadales bacterium]